MSTLARRLAPANLMLCSIALACSPPERNATPGRDENARGNAGAHASAEQVFLAGDGVGCVKVGASVAATRSRCDVTRDTTVDGPEGMPERQLEVALPNATVTAVVVHDTVWRVAADAPVLRTGDSLGVGTTARQLLETAGATVIEGEGRIFVTTSAHCGMSFRLDLLRRGRSEPAESLVRRDAGARVDRVLMFGCS